MRHHSEILPYRHRIGPSIVTATGVTTMFAGAFAGLHAAMLGGLLLAILGDVWLGRLWKHAVTEG